MCVDGRFPKSGHIWAVCIHMPTIVIIVYCTAGNFQELYFQVLQAVCLMSKILSAMLVIKVRNGAKYGLLPQLSNYLV